MIKFLKKRYNMVMDYIKNSQKLENELLYAHIFESTIRGSVWLKENSFSFTGGACNYSFAYILYRILETEKPLNILEMGLGQTSKITTQYILNKNENASLDIVEHDKKWIEIFKENIKLNDGIKIHNPSLEVFEFQNVKNYKYENLKQHLGNKKYNLIIIDGPYGGGNFSRSDILDIIPENLDDDFIIILDDVERAGEFYLMNRIFEKLDSLSIEYEHKTLKGTKSQAVIMCKARKYVKFYC